METVRALAENLAALLRREHDALADFLVALADFDHRRCWVALGHSSLFYFLHRELRLSKGAAQYRKVAAELIQEVPGVVEPLRDGRLCLTSITEAAKVVTAENWETVLPRFYGLSKREAMEVVAVLQPHPAPPTRDVVSPVRVATPVRPVPASVGHASAGSTLALGDALGPALAGRSLGWPDEPPAKSVSPSFPGPVATSPVVTASGVTTPELTTPAFSVPVSAAALANVRPVDVVPLTSEHHRLHATVSSEFMAKLAAARDALSHAHPDATLGEILEAGLDLLLAQAAKKKGLVAKPRSGKGSMEGLVAKPRSGEGSAEALVAKSRDGKGSPEGPVAKPRNRKGSTEMRTAKSDHIPAHVKREVWKRDGGRCQWPLHSGGICGSTRCLELDHIQPRSRGGASTVDNLRVLCRGHNDLAARLALGDAQMDSFTRGLAGAPRGPQASRSEPPPVHL